MSCQLHSKYVKYVICHEHVQYEHVLCVKYVCNRDIPAGCVYRETTFSAK